MRFASFNVNSIRARLDQTLSWLKEAKPDFLFLQELKCETASFPLEVFASAGYPHCLIEGQKAYNGVALVSSTPLRLRHNSLPGAKEDVQARYIEAETEDGMILVCLYLPNGNPVESEKFTYKLSWMDRLYAHIKEVLIPLEQPFLLGGDFNICPESGDAFDGQAIKDDALGRPESRARFRKFLHLGLTDAFHTLHPKEDGYSYWDYQKGRWPRNEGLRIDFFLLSAQAADRLVTCEVDKSPRGQNQASDHTPLLLSLKPR